MNGETELFQRIEVLERELAEVKKLAGGPSDLIPLKRAAEKWRITESAALMRARRGTGVKVAGRWYVQESSIIPSKAG